MYSFDKNIHLMWPRYPTFGRIQGRCIRRTWPDDYSVDGYSCSWRVAIERSMGRHRYHYSRRLPRQWRTVANTQVAAIRVKGRGCRLAISDNSPNFCQRDAWIFLRVHRDEVAEVDVEVSRRSGRLILLRRAMASDSDRWRGLHAPHHRPWPEDGYLRSLDHLRLDRALGRLIGVHQGKFGRWDGTPLTTSWTLFRSRMTSHHADNLA